MGSLVGAGIGLAGSLISGNKQEKAAKKAAKAAEFKPYSGNMPFGGGIEFDRKNQTFDVNVSEQDQALFDLFNQQAMQNFQGGGYGGLLAGQLEQQAGGAIPGLFNQAQFAAGQLPTQLTQDYMQGSFGRSQFADQLAGQFMGQAAGGPGGYDPLAMQAIQQGFQGYNTPGPGSYQDVYQNRLGLLREQAEPFERRNVLGELNEQFGRGIMNASAGQLRQEGLASGLAQADTARQLDAMGFSENLWNRDMQNVLQQRQQGLGMLNQGFGFQGQQGQLGLGHQQFAGQMGANLLGAGQQFQGQGFGAGTALNELQNQRAMQRLGAAQQLFGFGNQQQLQNINTGFGMLGAGQGMQGQYRDWIATGGNLGGAQASAGANAGRYMVQGAQNNMGDFLAGAGGGLFDASIGGDMKRIGGMLGTQQVPTGYDPSGFGKV